MSERRRELCCFLAAGLISFLLWYFAAFLFGVAEPVFRWPYLLALLLLGGACRLLFDATPKLIYGGIVAGQFAGGYALAEDFAQFCATCHLVPILLSAMAAGFGAWVVALRR